MYEFVLTDGSSRWVELEIDQLDVECKLDEGTWFVDRSGYSIAPHRVMMFRLAPLTGGDGD